MIKRFSLSIVTLLAVLFVFQSVAFAGESIFRLKGTYVPEQEVSATPGPAPEVKFDLDNSFGAYAEWGKESPNKYLYGGVEAGFVNLSAFAPVAGVQDVEVQRYSLMAKLCTQLANDSSFTPFACGGVGLAFFDPSLTLAGGTTVNIDRVTASAFALEAGVRIRPKMTEGLGFLAGYRYDDTFNNPTFSVAGAPGASAEVDLAHSSVFVGIEF
jgi:opacity protein-like surface antigen